MYIAYIICHMRPFHDSLYVYHFKMLMMAKIINAIYQWHLYRPYVTNSDAQTFQK